MTLIPSKIVSIAESMITEVKGIPDPSMSNYHEVLAKYKRVLNDVLVMIRDLARAIPPPGDASP